jgi:hypothetical protein
VNLFSLAFNQAVPQKYTIHWIYEADWLWHSACDIICVIVRGVESHKGVVMKWAIQFTLVAAFLALIAGNLKADPVLLSYKLTGPGTIVTFDLPELPTSIAPLDDVAFYVQPTNLVIDGASSSDLLIFYTTDNFWGGAFDDVSDTPGFPGLMGDQLYTNGEETPEMLTGSFSLTDFATGTEAFSLDVTPVSSPESSTLVLFGVGLIALAVMRKRRMATANFSA